MLKVRLIALMLLGACVADADDQTADTGPDGLARAATTPESCDVTVVEASTTQASVAGQVHCTGQSVAIVQVGVGTTWGDWDSLIVDCHEAFQVTIPLAPASGPNAWAMIDALEWPYTMDSGFVHCGTGGSPPQ